MTFRVLLPAGALLLGGWATARAIRVARYPLRDKVALITGGSRGLGLALAQRICAGGGHVALLARDLDELARAKAELEPYPGVVLTVQCDLLDPQQIQAAVRQVLDRFGKIDILINNAGIIEVGPLELMTRQDFEQAMRLHFWAPFELISLVVPEMRRWGGGRIVNISSVGGRVAVPHLAPYSASKFALTGFSDAIRAELAGDNIAVTTVAPGMMRTGSHVHARFRGRHNLEYAWFATAARAPLISMNANRAARKILAACRRGQPSLILTLAARLQIVAGALFPNLTGYAMKLVNRFLPRADKQAGCESRAGAELDRQRLHE
jgi:NAD(P)-dependent dehydrogenase (short-subunit alcohol dehydrogenase family)